MTNVFSIDLLFQKYSQETSCRLFVLPLKNVNNIERLVDKVFMWQLLKLKWNTKTYLGFYCVYLVLCLSCPNCRNFLFGEPKYFIVRIEVSFFIELLLKQPRCYIFRSKISLSARIKNIFLWIDNIIISYFF